MTNPKISRAKTSEYNELIHLWQASVKATHHFLTEKDIKQYRLLIRDYYFDQLSLYHIRYSDRIVGFIGLKKEFIQMLFVAPAEMGKGIGKALTKFAISKHSAKTVDVNEQNTNAMGFYTKMGFEKVDRSDADDAGKPFPIISLKLAG